MKLKFTRTQFLAVVAALLLCGCAVNNAPQTPGGPPVAGVSFDQLVKVTCPELAVNPIKLALTLDMCNVKDKVEAVRCVMQVCQGMKAPAPPTQAPTAAPPTASPSPSAEPRAFPPATTATPVAVYKAPPPRLVMKRVQPVKCSPCEAGITQHYEEIIPVAVRGEITRTDPAYFHPDGDNCDSDHWFDKFGEKTIFWWICGGSEVFNLSPRDYDIIQEFEVTCTGGTVECKYPNPHHLSPRFSIIVKGHGGTLRVCVPKGASTVDGIVLPVTERCGESKVL